MSKQLTLGSLFSGIGGFELAGISAGIRPIWASEIEPFPIRVTTKRLPQVKHIGDIHALHGAEIEPVSIITFGSPCQNLSVSGDRSGVNGEKSSLFFEAIRVIREMREKTDGQYPRWVVWENVAGALSACHGESFRKILESLVQIRDPEAAVPMPEKGKWLHAGEIMGDGYSLAWRILNATGFGVPQRRRRIFAVVDLDGRCAGTVLFESEGLSGYSPPAQPARENIAGGVAAGAGTAGGLGAVGFEPGALKRKPSLHAWHEMTSTLRAQMGDNAAAVAYGISSYQSKGMLSANPLAGIYEADTSRTLDCSDTDPSKNQGGIAIVKPAPTYCMTVGGFAQVREDESTTLEARGFKDPPVIGRPDIPPTYIVRRLTPDECALLQGYPVDHCHGLETENPTEADIDWWYDVFEAHRKALGKSTKPRSRVQITKWLQNPRSDAAEYKAFGNSIAAPCVHFVLAGIVWAHEKEVSP